MSSAVSELPDRSSPRPKGHVAAATSDASTAGDAISLAFDDPRGTGEPILFVHGFSHNGSVWSGIAESLPERWRPVSVDLRGHGRSPWSPSGAYHLRDYARDLPGVLDRLGIEAAHVVGHSLGGNVSTLFVADEPERVRSLSLVDTGPTLEAAGSAHVMGDVDDALRSYAAVSEYRSQLGQLHPQADVELLDRLAASSLVRRLDGRFELALDPGVLGLDQPVCSSDDAETLREIERTLWSSLESLPCPLLVLRGGLSAIFNEEVACDMVARAPQPARFVTLPRAGHAIMLEDGPGLQAALVDYLGSLPASQRATSASNSLSAS